MPGNHTYVLRSSNTHKKLFDNEELSDEIRDLSPLNDNLDLSVPFLYSSINDLSDIEEESSLSSDSDCVIMASKQDIEDLLKTNNSRKSFQPSKFSGKTSENAREFLSTFNNYCKLNNISGDEKLLSFEMCITGAAKSWFNGLTTDTINDFNKVQSEFNENFVQNNAWINTTRLDNRRLLPTESAEQYIADVSELAQLVGATDNELSKALIRGLPNGLRWNVISFNPKSLSDTIQRILLGEATLSMADSVNVNAIDGTITSAVSKIEDKVDRLAELMRSNLQQQHQQEQPAHQQQQQQQWQSQRRPEWQLQQQQPVQRQQGRYYQHSPPRYNRSFGVTCRSCGVNGHFAANCRNTVGNTFNRNLQRNNNDVNNQRYSANRNQGNGFYNRSNYRGGVYNNYNSGVSGFNRNPYPNQFGYTPKNDNVPRV